MVATLAWRNIWRQPHRTLLSLSSIVVASVITIFLLSLQRGAYGTMKENVLRLIDGFAQIQPPGYSDDPDLHRTIADPDAIMRKISADPAVTAMAPRAASYVIASNGTRSYGAALFGVDPAREARLATLPGTITTGRFLKPSDGASVVVGSGLARNLKLEVGSRLTVLGGARDGSVAADVLTVEGIFSTGAHELDREAMEMPLARFQNDFALGGRVNVIALGGRRLAEIDSRLAALRRTVEPDGLVVRGWTELEPALSDVILLDASFSLLMYASLVIIVVFIILNTLLMSVLERTREFGVLLALGMRPDQIGRMIWLELLFLAGTGAVIGIALGSGVTQWLAGNGIPFAGAEDLFRQWHMPSTLFPQLDWTSALAGPGAILLAIALAGFVPYRRVLRLKPAAAMRAT